MVALPALGRTMPHERENKQNYGIAPAKSAAMRQLDRLRGGCKLEPIGMLVKIRTQIPLHSVAINPAIPVRPAVCELHRASPFGFWIQTDG